MDHLAFCKHIKHDFWVKNGSLRLTKKEIARGKIWDMERQEMWLLSARERIGDHRMKPAITGPASEPME